MDYVQQRMTEEAAKAPARYAPVPPFQHPPAPAHTGL